MPGRRGSARWWAAVASTSSRSIRSRALAETRRPPASWSPPASFHRRSSSSGESPTSRASPAASAPASPARSTRRARPVAGSPSARRSSSAESWGSLRRRWGGFTSSTRPPPRVAPSAPREKPRSTKASPGSTATGSPSRCRRAKPVAPGARRSEPMGAMRARHSRVPHRKETGAGSSSAGEDGSQCTRASRLRVGSTAPGALSTWPRASAASDTPWRFTAQRVPGSTFSTDWPWHWRPRTRADAEPGSSSTASPTESEPPSSVPVTTGPKPRISKQRSTGSRGGPRRGVRGCAEAASAASSSRQRLHSLAGLGRNAQQRGARQGGGCQQIAHLGLGQRGHLLVHRVHLRQRHHAPLDPQQLGDGQVLPGLGHHALFRRDHQQQQVDAGRARHHGAHQTLVARHVHHPELCSVGQGEGGEAQLQGDAPALLLRQPVRVHAGEGEAQGGLAVIDVAGGAQDQRRATVAPGLGLSGGSSASKPV